jgi:nitrite reductase (NADH) small subunit
MSTAALEEPPPDADAWDAAAWEPVCALDDVVPDTGVCALIAGRQIAIVRVGEGDQIYAIDNYDPFSNAFVISRGIVGDKNGVPKIASPIFKQSFSLLSGQCLDDPATSIPVYPARVRDGQIQIHFTPPA